MKTKTFEAKDLIFGWTILLGKKTYDYVGTVHQGTDMLIVNFFLGENDARLGKIIVPSDFPFEVVQEK